MGKLRVILLAAITAMGSGAIALLVMYGPQGKLDLTFAPAFELLGRTPRAMNSALTRAVPVDAIDEKEYGEAIAKRYESASDEKSPEHRYLNELVKALAAHAGKPFTYRVFIMERDEPNAFAMPGGVIFVTRGMIASLKNEAELAAVISHEMGHIELSHCFDAVRFELLSRKTGARTLGSIADFAVSLMLRHTFSKTQEDQADEYAFDMVRVTLYDPLAVSGVFDALLAYEKAHGRRNAKGHALREYFMTHPHTDMRKSRYLERANAWWRSHDDEKRYRGALNLKKRIPLDKKAYDREWVDAGKAIRNKPAS